MLGYYLHRNEDTANHMTIVEGNGRKPLKASIEWSYLCASLITWEHYGI